MIRLELDGKYWVIERNDKTLTVHWGAPGRAEQSHHRSCASDAEAETKVAELIAKQRALGYTDAVAQAPVDEPIAQDAYWSCKLESRGQYIDISLGGSRVAEDRQKFWKTGVKGHVKPVYTDHSDAAAARAAFDAVVNQALRDGFELVASKAAVLHDMRVPLVVASNAALEAECRAHPDDPAPWIVYADWLTSRGDPCGEIVALRRAGQTERAAALLAERDDQLLGDNAGLVAITRWRHGFPSAVSIASFEEAKQQKRALEQLVAAPLARFVEELTIDLAVGHSGAALLNTLGAAPGIHTVTLDGLADEEAQISFTTYGNLGQSWKHLQHLRSLEIVAQNGKLGTIDLPNLVKLVRVSGGMPVSEVTAIGAAAWPALEHLELWIGAAQYGATVTLASLAPILDGKRFPALTHLALCNTELGDGLLTGLAGSRLLPRLRTLVLAMNDLTTESMLEHAPAFRHLAVLDLSDNSLDARVTAALPNAVLDTNNAHRYRAVGE